MESLVAIVTNLCNLDCTHCLRDHNTVSISPKLFRNAVLQAKKLGCERIRFTGGEAGLHPQFDELVEFVVGQGLNFNFITNGWRFERYLPLLEYGERLTHVYFSLDGATPGTHDAIREKGSHKRVMSGIERFVDEGKDVRVQMCISRRNMKEIEAVMDLCADLGVEQLRFLGVIPCKESDEALLTNEDRIQCSRRIWDRAKTKSSPAYVMSSLLFMNQGENYCGGLNLSSLGVTPEGNIKFCCDHTEDAPYIGSLVNESLGDIIERGEHIADLLRARRRLYLLNGEEYEGCDSCLFCIRSMKELQA